MDLRNLEDKLHLKHVEDKLYFRGIQDKSILYSVNGAGEIALESGTTEILRPNSQVALSNFLLNGQFQLNYIEWRLFFSMLSCIEESDTEFKIYHIRVQDIIQLSELKSGSHLYDEVAKNIKSLMSHVVEWEESPGKTRFAQLVSKVSYFKSQGIVLLQPHPDMKPHFLQLRKEFTQAQLKQCLRFSSPYTSRLYMLLKQFDSPTSGIRIMSITELRFKLSLDYTERLSTGKEVSYSTYPLYADLKRWVIEPAQKEIAKTDIPFEFIPIKTGRKVTAIRFVLKGGKKLRSIPEKAPEHPQMTEREAQVYGRLHRFKFTDFQIRTILQNGSLEEINSTCYQIQTTDWSSIGKPVHNKAAYAYGIFKKKFGLP